jgi:GTP-binding protein
MAKARRDLLSHGLPVLALVGRPNAGKSTLFNRLIGERKAIVDPTPGVTRDLNYAEVDRDGKSFIVIDTGGLDSAPGSPLEEAVQAQARLAMREADVILYLLDGRAGLTPLDRELARLLRAAHKPVLVAVNKLDTPPKEELLYEFYELGWDELFPLSAEHGRGVSELLDRLVESFPSAPAEDESEEDSQPRPLSIAIAGRPNAGKSTLVNRLLGRERSLVDASPGTTRDAVHTPFVLGGEPCLLVDTAGIRRKARVAAGLERASVVRSLRSVDRSDVAVYLVDGAEGITDQDAKILSYIAQRGKGLVLAVNKWDLMTGDERSARFYRKEVYRNLPFADFAPVVFVSGLKGEGMRELIAAIKRVARSYQLKIQTSKLNQALREIVQRHPPPLHQNRAVKLFYATQTAVHPPTLTLFVNSPAGITPAYERYLAHELRSHLDLEGSPLRLVFRPRREEDGEPRALRGANGDRVGRRKRR